MSRHNRFSRLRPTCCLFVERPGWSLFFLKLDVVVDTSKKEGQTDKKNNKKKKKENELEEKWGLFVLYECRVESLKLKDGISPAIFTLYFPL